MAKLNLFALFAVVGTPAFAGCLIPQPGAGVAGPMAIIAAVGAVAGLKYLRGRKSN